MIDHINAYVLTVHNFEKCLKFYRETLGFKLETQEEGFAYLTFSQGGAGIALSTIDGAVKLISEKQIMPKEKPVHRNYFAVFLKDVDKEYEELKAKGVHFVKPPTTFPWGQRIAYFEDPEGNLGEISQFIKKSGPETQTASIPNSLNCWAGMFRFNVLIWVFERDMAQGQTRPESRIDSTSRLGSGSLWVSDRLLLPTKPRETWGSESWPDMFETVYDPIETLTWIAAQTKTVMLGTSVLSGLFQNPVTLARGFATLDRLSHGRAIAGIGQGDFLDEFEAAGIPRKRRGRGFEEFIKAIKAVWGPDPG